MIEIRSGEAVKITSPDNFKGGKLGILLGKCKKCSSPYKVWLTDPDFPFRELCISIDRGDTIVPLKAR